LFHGIWNGGKLRKREKKYRETERVIREAGGPEYKYEVIEYKYFSSRGKNRDEKIARK
jgi:hypothetical protein